MENSQSKGQAVVDTLQVAEALSQAITRQDVVATGRLLAESAIVWHSYDGIEQGRETTLAHLEAIFRNAAKISYTDIRRHRIDEGFVQQHILHCVLNDGTIFVPRPVCMVARLHRGKIERLDEYLEPRRIMTEPAIGMS